MAYKDSDYTIVIAVMHWPKCMILLLKLALVLKLWVLLSSCLPPLLERSLWLSLEVQLSGKADKDSDYAIVHWRLSAKTHPGGEVMSIVIIFRLLSGRHCIVWHLKQRDHHVSCGLIGTSSDVASCLQLYGSHWTRLEYKLVDTKSAQISTRSG